MDAVRIRRLKKRYRLPVSAEETRHRLDRIFGMVLDGRLELALERTGVSPHEQICVRASSSLFRPRLSLPDESLATHWSLLLAEAIQQVAYGRAIEGVVRYSSRTHALIDMAAGVLRADYRRGWAWRQLGFWKGGERPPEREAVSEMVRALLSEPQAVVPVLIALVRSGLTGPLCAWLETGHWTTLAVAASHAVAAPAGLAYSTGSLAAPQSTEVQREIAACCRQILRSSKLGLLTALIAEESIAALAVLAVIESDPILVRRDRTFLDGLLAEMRGELRRRQTTASRDDASVTKTPADPPELPADDTLPEDSPPQPIRVEGRTDYGGLLFLLNVIGDLDLVLRLSKTLQPRPLAWALHLLALTLTDVPPNDAGALAFAGLAPDAEPPSSPEDPPSDEELEAVHSIAAAILAEVEKRLQHLELPPEHVLRFVCRRAAKIAADPGWIEAHFSLDDVSTELRRVGLDLDPGYLPWLGVVVKFVYE
jgi:hypothetical protein